jgi:hypothetical protein
MESDVQELVEIVNAIKESPSDEKVLEERLTLIGDEPDGIQVFLDKMIAKQDSYTQAELVMLQTLERHPQFSVSDNSLWKKALKRDVDKDTNVPLAYISELTQSLMRYPLSLSDTANTVIDYQDALKNPVKGGRRLDPVIFILK